MGVLGSTRRGVERWDRKGEKADVVTGDMIAMGTVVSLQLDTAGEDLEHVWELSCLRRKEASTRQWLRVFLEAQLLGTHGWPSAPTNLLPEQKEKVLSLLENLVSEENAFFLGGGVY